LEAKKVTTDVWRDDDFEERNFDPRLYAATGATTSIIEGKSYLPYRKQQYADIIYVGPAGKLGAIEVKISPARQDKYFVWSSALRSSYWSNREHLIIDYSRALDELFNQSTIVLSQSAIYELRNSELGGTFATSYVDFQDEEPLAIEVIHPLTSSIYNQLTEIPTPTREAIQDVLKKFATSVSYAPTTELPPLRLTVLEDSSYLLEWTFEDRRLGFSFEQNPKDSGWYYVYSSDSSERYESGTMDQLEMSRLIGMMLKV
jgi:hypothetical protein